MKAFTLAPVTHDGDSDIVNYVLHPEMGAEIYLMIRDRDYEPWTAFLFSTATSVSWEYVYEGWVERPSSVDLLMTSTTGSLLGELRYQLRQHFIEEPPSTWRTVGIVLADGIEAFHRWVHHPSDADISDPDSTGEPVPAAPVAGLSLTVRF